MHQQTTIHSFSIFPFSHQEEEFKECSSVTSSNRVISDQWAPVAKSKLMSNDKILEDMKEQVTHTDDHAENIFEFTDLEFESFKAFSEEKTLVGGVNDKLISFNKVYDHPLTAYHS